MPDQPDTRAMPNGTERPGEHWNARLIREDAERATPGPVPSFAEHFQADERDQLDARAAAAEQERDEARDERDQLRYERRLLGTCRVFLDGLAERGVSINLQRAAADLAQRIVDEIGQACGNEPAIGPNLRFEITKLREQLADAHAAGARSATEADQLRKQCDALEDARRQLSTEVTKWKTRLVDETDRLRDRLDRANAVARAGWDPTTPQWAVIRAAINWRVSGVGVPDHALDDQERALVEAVDALPHIGEIRDEHGPETPAPKLAQGGPVSRGVTLHFDPPPLVVRYIPVPYDPRTGRLL